MPKCVGIPCWAPAAVLGQFDSLQKLKQRFIPETIENLLEEALDRANVA